MIICINLLDIQFNIMYKSSNNLHKTTNMDRRTSYYPIIFLGDNIHEHNLFFVFYKNETINTQYKKRFFIFAVNYSIKGLSFSVPHL